MNEVRKLLSILERIVPLQLKSVFPTKQQQKNYFRPYLILSNIKTKLQLKQIVSPRTVHY